MGEEPIYNPLKKNYVAVKGSPLYLYTKPKLKNPVMIIGLAGWPDAGGVSSLSVSYLKEVANATPLGEIDMSDHIDLTKHRPIVVIQDGMVRSIELPKFELNYILQANRDVIVVSGYEPMNGWNAFVNALFEVAETFGVSLLITIGGLIDAVPHTRPTRISFLTSDEDLRKLALRLGMIPSNYSGPGSIHSFVMSMSSKIGLSAISIWGHVPSYLTMPSPRIISSVLEKVAQIAEIDIDLSRLYVEASVFEGKLNDFIASNPDMRELIEKLEKEYDDKMGSPEYIK